MDESPIKNCPFHGRSKTWEPIESHVCWRGTRCFWSDCATQKYRKFAKILEKVQAEKSGRKIEKARRKTRRGIRQKCDKGRLPRMGITSTSTWNLTQKCDECVLPWFSDRVAGRLFWKVPPTQRPVSRPCADIWAKQSAPWISRIGFAGNFHESFIGHATLF